MINQISRKSFLRLKDENRTRNQAKLLTLDLAIIWQLENMVELALQGILGCFIQCARDAREFARFRERVREYRKSVQRFSARG